MAQWMSRNLGTTWELRLPWVGDIAVTRHIDHRGRSWLLRTINLPLLNMTTLEAVDLAAAQEEALSRLTVWLTDAVRVTRAARREQFYAKQAAKPGKAAPKPKRAR